MFRFSIRDLLWLTVVVAMVLGWSIHAVRYSKLQKEYRATRSRFDTAKALAKDLAQLNIVEDGQGVQVFMPNGWPQSIPQPKLIGTTAPTALPANAPGATGVPPPVPLKK